MQIFFYLNVQKLTEEQIAVRLKETYERVEDAHKPSLEELLRGMFENFQKMQATSDPTLQSVSIPTKIVHNLWALFEAN